MDKIGALFIFYICAVGVILIPLGILFNNNIDKFIRD